jgi:hypothetical protein
MMFICWGIGHVTNRVFHTDAGYSDAVRALQRARVTVFSIDAASGHDLQGGLQAIASDTGGFYATSFPFAAITMHRLHHTLAGHYEIEVRRMPSRQHGDHSITVTVASPQRLYVMARRTFSD